MTKKSRQQRFAELQAASDENRVASTIVIAKSYLKDFPDHLVAWMHYGVALVESARYVEAQRVFQRALRLSPKDWKNHVYVQLGHLYKMKGEFKTAIRWYRKACAGNPDDAGNFIFLGVVLALQGKLKAAERCHRRAVRCQKGCKDEAFLNLGLVLRSQERYPEAQTYFEKTLKIDPKSESAQTELNDILAVSAILGHKE